MKVLLIEDEFLISKAISHVVKKLGYNITTTNSGLEAIKYLKKNKYDKIITDLMLVDISGFDIIEECKKLQLISQVSIITAYNSPEIIKRAKEYNCPIYFKPFNNLIETIKTILYDQNKKQSGVKN